MKISAINASIGLRVYTYMKDGGIMPMRLKVSLREWSDLNRYDHWETDPDGNIKWNDSVLIIKPYKPRITKKETWLCVGKETVGGGSTPSEAYNNYIKSLNTESESLQLIKKLSDV